MQRAESYLVKNHVLRISECKIIGDENVVSLDEADIFDQA